ncbi:MAG: hypothetical protein U0Q16_16105 [Bryobacteraceae bacterium]
MKVRPGGVDVTVMVTVTAPAKRKFAVWVVCFTILNKAAVFVPVYPSPVHPVNVYPAGEVTPNVIGGVGAYQPDVGERVALTSRPRPFVFMMSSNC